jgi:hypothetical protein
MYRASEKHNADAHAAEPKSHDGEDSSSEVRFPVVALIARIGGVV